MEPVVSRDENEVPNQTSGPSMLNNQQSESYEIEVAFPYFETLPEAYFHH